MQSISGTESTIIFLPSLLAFLEGAAPGIAADLLSDVVTTRCGKLRAVLENKQVRVQLDPIKRHSSKIELDINSLSLENLQPLNAPDDISLDFIKAYRELIGVKQWLEEYLSKASKTSSKVFSVHSAEGKAKVLSHISVQTHKNRNQLKNPKPKQKTRLSKLKNASTTLLQPLKSTFGVGATRRQSQTSEASEKSHRSHLSSHYSSNADYDINDAPNKVPNALSRKRDESNENRFHADTRSFDSTVSANSRTRMSKIVDVFEELDSSIKGIMDGKLHNIYRKYQAIDLRILVVFIVSVYFKPGLLSEEVRNKFLDPSMINHLSKRLNQIEGFLQVLQLLPKESFVALGHLVHFFSLNSEQKKDAFSDFSPVIFTNYLSYTEFSSNDVENGKIIAGLMFQNGKNLFASIYEELDYVLELVSDDMNGQEQSSVVKEPQDDIEEEYIIKKGKKYKRKKKNRESALWLQKKYEMRTMKTNDIVEDPATIRRHKEELKDFYAQYHEKRFAVIIEDLFALYSFKTIAKGIYRKYDGVMPENWLSDLKNQKKLYQITHNDDLTFWFDNDGARINNSVLPGDKRFRNIARRLPGSTANEQVGVQYDSLSKETKIEEIVDLIVTEEITFNERLRNLKKFYLEDALRPILSQKGSPAKYLLLSEKDIQMLFDDAFSKLLKLSNNITVRLEILNLIDKPPENVKNITRTDLLVDSYANFIQEFFDVYAGYIDSLDSKKRLIFEKEEYIRSRLNKNFMGMNVRNSNLSFNAKKRTKETPEVEYNKSDNGKLLMRINGPKKLGNVTNVTELSHNNLLLSRSNSQRQTTMNNFNNHISANDFSHNSSDEINIAELPKLLANKPSTNAAETGSLKSDAERSKQSRKTQRAKSRNGSSFLTGGTYKNFLQIWDDVSNEVLCFSKMSLLEVLSAAGARAECIRLNLQNLKSYFDDGSGTRYKVIELMNKFTDIEHNLKKKIKQKEKLGSMAIGSNSRAVKGSIITQAVKRRNKKA